jgi:hypothetical protein
MITEKAAAMRPFSFRLPESRRLTARERIPKCTGRKIPGLSNVHPLTAGRVVPRERQTRRNAGPATDLSI